MRGAVSEGTETETSKGAQLLSTPVGVRTRAWKVKTKTWNFKNSSVVYQEYLQKYLTFYAEPATTWKEEILPNVCRLQIFILICKPKSNIFEFRMNCEIKSLTPIVKYRGNFEFMKDNCQVTLYFEFGKEYQKVTKGEYGEYFLLGIARHLLMFFFWF